MREAASPKASTATAIKSQHRKHLKTGATESLKKFARSLTGDDKVAVESWFFNKRANFANPPQGLGSTRKKKGATGKK